jgi:hypothetical protein
MPDMIKLLLTFSAAFILSVAGAQTLRTPAPSPTQTVKQEFGLSAVDLSYSRPAVKGRKIFGDLVPFGNVWRTGANSATTITFGEEVLINGKKVPAGKYGFLTIPGKDNWTLIITKQVDVTSPAAYKQENDVVRMVVKPVTINNKIENLTLQIGNITSNSCELQLMWDNTFVALPISSDVDTKVMGQIDQLMNKDNKPYYNAAMYYLQNGKDLNQAVAWFDKAVVAQPDAFWVHHYRASALAKLGKKKEAKEAAEKSIGLAKAAKNDDYVKLNTDLIATL